MKKNQLMVFIMSSLVVAVGCQSGAMRERAKEEAIRKGMKDLNGTWVLMWEETDGEKVFDAATNAHSAETMVLQDGIGSGRSGSEEDCEFTFAIDPTKTPKTLDLLLVKGTGIYKPFEGNNSLAIYELNRDTLKTCFTFFAVQRERPTEFATKPKSSLLLNMWRREKK